MSIGKIDFFVHEGSNDKETAHREIEYAFCERNRAGKNTFIAHTGKSREGKSSITLKEIEFMLEMRDIPLLPHINDIFVYTPLEYPNKLDRMLYAPELKDINFLVIDDARYVIHAKKWQSFLNQAIADISSISGRIKPLTVFINTQFLKDIDLDFRLALDFWGSVYRPLHDSPEVRYSRFWLDESDPEKLRMRKRKFKGVVVDADNKRYIDEPNKFVFTMPSHECWKVYDSASYNAKGRLIKRRMDSLMAEIKKETGDDKLAKMIEWYSNPARRDELMSHFEYKYKKLKLRREAYDVLRLEKNEGMEFTKRIQEALKLGRGMQENVST